MNTLESYRETYKSFSDDELVRMYQRIEDLEDLAQIALREELNTRGYDQTKLTESLGELKHLDTIAGLEIPSLVLIRGIGRKFFGRKSISILEGEQMEEYDTTLWFVLFWFPVVPIASYRIRRRVRNWWQGFETGDVSAVARYPRDWNQITATWIKTALIIMAAYVSFQLLISPPKFRPHRSVLYSYLSSAPLTLRVSAVN
jgi:hypothetical protein